MDYLKKYRNIFDQNIILLFKGPLNFDLVTSMIATLGDRLNINDEHNPVARKFYNVATECIQNIYYQLDEIDFKGKIGTYDARSALIMVAARKKFYSIQTGNYIPSKRTEELKKRLDEIKDMPMDELKTLYKQLISEESFTTKGPFGLGFIDIARKAGDEKLRYRIQEVNEHLDFFTFQIRISRN